MAFVIADIDKMVKPAVQSGDVKPLCSKCGSEMVFNIHESSKCICPACGYKSRLYEACGFIKGLNKYHD